MIALGIKEEKRGSMEPITVYKRHSVGCPEEADRFSRKCKCRIWLQYQEHGKQIQVDLPPVFSPRIMRLSPGLGSPTQPS